MTKPSEKPRRLRVADGPIEVIGFQVIAYGRETPHNPVERLYETQIGAEAAVNGRKNLFRIQPVPRFGGAHDARERALALKAVR